MKRRLIVCIAVVMLALMHGVCTYAAVIDSGKCGDNVTWSLDDNGLLTISGTGDMYDYDRNNCAPWYKERSDIDRVSISDGVTRIGNSAFYWYYRLQNINIPNSVIEIGAGAFEDCSSLTSIEIPANVSTIEDDTFSGCSSLTSINIPNSVTEIGSYAFSGCSGLTSIEIPAKVYNIGEYAFSDCSSLTNITGVGRVNEIKKGTFKGCRNLTSVYLPSFVGSIGDMAFARCSNLSKIVCEAAEPPTCGSNAFYGVNRTTCQLEVIEQSIDKYKAADQWKDFVNIAATTVRKCGDNIVWTLEDGNLSISGTGEMYNYYEPYKYTNTCPWGNLIKTVTISDGVTTIGSDAFYGCSSLMSVVIPSSMIEIGDRAFSNCSSLTSIEIPNSVTVIDEYTFYGCSSLTSIEIPNSVTVIYGYTFYGCSSLAEIKCEAVEPPSCNGSNVFGDGFYYGVNKTDCKLYVPEESIEKYRAANQWKDFANIIGLSGVDDVAADSEVAVNVTGNTLVVDGADAGEMLEVYSAAGAAVYRGSATTIALPGAGIYIVKIAGKVLKLAAN